jgi:Cdc6-like AAA superfamily ATPase
VKIRNWLSAPDPSENYHKALKLRQAGSGDWILKSDKFSEWKNDISSFLWLYGIPGCGKTILCSTVLESVLEHCQDDIGKVTAYFFFDFTDPKKQNTDIMVRSLISQLTHRVTKVSAPLETLFSSCGNGETRPSPDSIMEVLREMISEFPQVFIILDALDECADRKELLDVIQRIQSWNLDNLHILTTSRKERDIDDSFRSSLDQSKMINLQNKQVDLDIQSYIHQRLQTDQTLEKWRKDDSILREIETTLIKGANGM